MPRTQRIQDVIRRFTGRDQAVIPGQLESIQSDLGNLINLCQESKNRLESLPEDTPGLEAVLAIQGNILSSIAVNSNNLRLLSSLQAEMSRQISEIRNPSS